MIRDLEVLAIAAKFNEILHQWLSEEEYAEMKRRNEYEMDYAGSACASHDFCDANMPMMEAFNEVTGREVDGDNEEDCKLWGDAWNMARQLYIGSPEA